MARKPGGRGYGQVQDVGAGEWRVGNSGFGAESCVYNFISFNPGPKLPTLLNSIAEFRVP